MNSKILACGVSLPKASLIPDTLLEDVNAERDYGIPNNYMSQELGILERRVAESGLQPSSLAIDAANEALGQRPDIDPAKIGLVLFCGISRDQEEPATAHHVNQGIGLNAHTVHDCSNACFGFLEGIKTAHAYIVSGMTEYALVTTGEVHEPLIGSFMDQLKKGIDIKTARALIGFLSVGDGGGAVLMGPSSDESGFQLFNSTVDSSQLNRCFYRYRAEGGFEGGMQMAQIVARGFRMQKKILPDTMAKLGWDEFDWVLGHQTGQRNFQQMAGLGIVKEKNMIKTYDFFGNTTTVTFPLCWYNMLKRNAIKAGDRIGGFFGGSGMVIGQTGYVL